MEFQVKKKQPKDPMDPRPLSWVKLNTAWMTKEQIDGYVEVFGRADSLLYMGEIPNQRGHCIVFNQDDNKMHVGFHIENFIEMTEEEV